MNLGNFLSALAARNPRKTAGVFENERISYEQLGHSSASLADWLLQPDSQPGDHFALYWPNSTELVKLLFEEMLQANERSWMYPAAIFVGLVGLVATLWIWRRHGPPLATPSHASTDNSRVGDAVETRHHDR